MDQVSAKTSGRLWTVRRYRPEDSGLWDRMVSESANGTFLHLRGYMDYHSDRFADHSLIALCDGRPALLLPADLTADRVLHSHRGLTYGGWIVPRRHFDGADMLGAFEAARLYCLERGIIALDYKPVPYIYALQPAQDDIYALWRQGAVASSCQLSCCIDTASWPGFNTLQRRHMRKALAAGCRIEETADVGPFWTMLADCLAERHDAAPVHTAAELQLLRDRFPDHIRVFAASDSEGMQAGVCVYVTERVAHCQYIATTTRGRQLNLLTPLMHHLITEAFADKRYFDMGTSNEEGGRILNSGLLRQKTSLGGSGVAYMRLMLDYTKPCPQP